MKLAPCKGSTSGYNGQRIIVVPPLDLVVVRLGVSPIDLAPELERFSQQTIDAFRPLLAPSQGSH